MTRPFWSVWGDGIHGTVHRSSGKWIAGTTLGAGFWLLGRARWPWLELVCLVAAVGVSLLLLPLMIVEAVLASLYWRFWPCRRHPECQYAVGVRQARTPREILSALRARLRRYPKPADAEAVRQMVVAQWRGIADRTPTYLAAYRDRPGSDDRAQRRARWLASLPVFATVADVLEIGCACGRNLAELRRAYPAMRLTGIDLNPAALAEAQPRDATFYLGDLTTPATLPLADVVLACGVLGHLPPREARAVVGRILTAARCVVIVDEVASNARGESEVIKGPRAWHPERATGDYVLWRHPLTRWFGTAQVEVFEDVPVNLRSPAATRLLVVRTPDSIPNGAVSLPPMCGNAMSRDRRT